MSIVPVMYDFAREWQNFKSLMSIDDFQIGSSPTDIYKMRSTFPIHYFYPEFLYYPFHHQLQPMPGLRGENVKVDKDGFQLTFDVKEFKPYELTVRTVNNFIVIEGRHEERKDDRNFSETHFSRTYLLPKGYDPNKVDSTISVNGVLCVKVPSPSSRAIEFNEKMVKIREIGSTYPALKDKEYF